MCDNMWHCRKTGCICKFAMSIDRHALALGKILLITRTGGSLLIGGGFRGGTTPDMRLSGSPTLMVIWGDKFGPESILNEMSLLLLKTVLLQVDLRLFLAFVGSDSTTTIEAQRFWMSCHGKEGRLPYMRTGNRLAFHYWRQFPLSNLRPFIEGFPPPFTITIYVKCPWNQGNHSQPLEMILLCITATTTIRIYILFQVCVFLGGSRVREWVGVGWLWDSFTLSLRSKHNDSIHRNSIPAFDSSGITIFTISLFGETLPVMS